MTTVRLGAAKTRHAIPREGALWMLTLFYVLCIIDRQILNVLAEPIARELNLSDTQIGLMAGLAFAVLYATLGIPLARHADRPGSNRIGLMSVCLFVWSGMTAMSGLAQNFVQMCAARIGVGIGEAGCTPAAHSMIADLYPPERRSSAMAVYGLGQPVGVIFGMMIGGLIADRWGWRMAFMVVGIPGMLVALLTPLLLKDPRRRATAARPTEAAGLAEVLGELLKSKTFMYMLVSGSVIAFLAYGMVVWTGIFFIRTFGLTPGQVGVWLGLVSGLSGAASTLLGGVLADRFGRARPARYLTLVVVALIIALPFQLAAYSAADWRVAMLLLIVPCLHLPALRSGVGPGPRRRAAPVPRHGLGGEVVRPGPGRHRRRPGPVRPDVGPPQSARRRGERALCPLWGGGDADRARPLLLARQPSYRLRAEAGLREC
jgi:MFS transporter, Spinster family, sphingosine-1-phosphate transporter